MTKTANELPQQPAPKHSGDDFKRRFARGLAALLPTALTVAILLWVYGLIDQYVGRYITEGMVIFFATSGTPTFVTPEDAIEYGQPINEWDEFGRRLTVEYKIATLPVLDETTTGYRQASPNDRKEADRARNRALWRVAFARYKLHLIGFLIAIILVYFVGLFLASLIGRTTWRLIERLLYRIPVVGAIYPNIKQVTDFLFTDRQLQFSGVVAVQYPRMGIWSLGLVTGPPLQSIEEKAGKEREMMNVFIPSSPTPVTGYVITVYRDEVIELGLSMDEVLRYVISGGVIKPERGALTNTTALPAAKP